MRKILLLILIFIIATLILILATRQKGTGLLISDKGRMEDLPGAVIIRETGTVVEDYLKLTLGTIPEAAVDYEKAKTLLVPEFAAQFTNSSFVPLSYCIQEGPLKTRIKSVDYSSANVTVKVDANYGYGEDWKEMWDFSLIKIADNWKIKAIKCLQLE